MNNNNDKFLTDNIITYLGNKRKLLGFINQEISQIIEQDEALSKKERSDITVFDIFSGSGVVSRNLKNEGYTVHCNDLEKYSVPINETFIGTNADELDGIFKGISEKLALFYTAKGIHFDSSSKESHYEQVIDMLNSVREYPNHEEIEYFSKHYAPKNTDEPDFDNERLFYTQENGRFLDAVIETVTNAEMDGKLIFNEQAKNIVLADVFHKMTKNINTSGTMKGFHNGWGGKAGNALERIKSNMKLDYLPLINGVKGVCHNDFAEKVFDKNPELKVDVIYADPPYNQHQYSANYHMLNSALEFDDKEHRYNPGEVEKGKRAGIRKHHNRSGFCFLNDKQKKNGDQVAGAKTLFDQFVKSVQNNTKYMIVSYNQEGVLDQQKLIDILSQNGHNTVNVKIQKHEKYKGGKNTNTSNWIVEYLFVVQMGKEQTQKELEKVKADTFVSTHQSLFLDKYLNPDAFEFWEERQDGSIAIFFEENNREGNFLLLDDSYKVIKDQLVNVDKAQVELILANEYPNKLRLMERYLKEKKYEYAIKFLNAFKIAKHKEDLKRFVVTLDNAELSNELRTEYNKVKEAIGASYSPEENQATSSGKLIDAEKKIETLEEKMRNLEQ